MSEEFWVEKWWELGEAGVRLKARHLLAHQYAVKFGTERAAKVLQGPWTMEEDAALRAISAAIAQQPAAVDAQDVDTCPQCGGGVFTIHHQGCKGCIDDECDWFKNYTTGRRPKSRG